jgi:mRNA interferase RelE/StbE
MTFLVRWDPKAEKQLEKLPKDAAIKIIAKVRLAAETQRFLEPLTEHEYGYKIRAGEYRVLVDVSHNPQELYVRYVGHRKNVYKRTQ